MTIRSSKRLGALVAASLFVAGACSSTGSTPSPSAASQAPGSQPASQPAAASGSVAPSQAAVTCPDPATATLTLQGAGATFPALLYQVWIEKFSEAHSNVAIDYQANGSGARHQGDHRADRRLRRLRRGDEGRRDRRAARRHEDPPRPDGTRRRRRHLQRRRASTEADQSSTSTADTIAGIFLGKITTWNDPTIAALNPESRQPAADPDQGHPPRPTGPARRTPSRPTSSTVSDDWKNGPARARPSTGRPATAPRATTASPAASRAATAASATSSSSTRSSRASRARPCKNANGKFVAGSSDGVTAAANGALDAFPADFRAAPIINGAGDTTYPIAVVHLPARLPGPDGRHEGPGPRRVHLLGPHRRPEGREGNRLRAVAGPGPAEGAGRAPLDHHRRHAHLGHVTRPPSARRPGLAGPGRFAVTVMVPIA